MSAQSYQSVSRDPLLSIRQAVRRFLNRVSLNRGAVYGAMILSALVVSKVKNRIFMSDTSRGIINSFISETSRACFLEPFEQDKKEN